MNTSKDNEAEKELETLGYVKREGKGFNQTSNNCFDIASYLAKKFGYWHPKSYRELREMIRNSRERQLFKSEPILPDIPSEACFLIRSPDNPTDAHVTFELEGKEFNYGPSTEQGFPIERRLYLRKIS